MRFGAHVSAKGGIANAPAEAGKLGCSIFQCFLRPPLTGKPLLPASEKEVIDFQEACATHHIEAVYVHAPYILNLASEKASLRANSIRILREELEQGSRLGIKGVMFHPGSAKELPRETAQQFVIESLDKILDGYEGTCRLLIENAAGSGSVMADRFEEVALFLQQAKHRSRLGVCIDTQHSFASGYDLQQHPDEVLQELDRVISIDHIDLFHLNDSKTALGSRKDRHEHLGKGEIGASCFLARQRRPCGEYDYAPPRLLRSLC